MNYHAEEPVINFIFRASYIFLNRALFYALVHENEILQLSSREKHLAGQEISTVSQKKTETWKASQMTLHRLAAIKRFEDN